MQTDGPIQVGRRDVSLTAFRSPSLKPPWHWSGFKSSRCLASKTRSQQELQICCQQDFAGIQGRGRADDVSLPMNPTRTIAAWIKSKHLFVFSGVATNIIFSFQ